MFWRIWLSKIVVGKSQFWLNIRSICLTLTFLSHCFCLLEEYCLYIKACLRELWPSVRVKLNCLYSEPYPPVDGRKEEINTSPSQGLLFFIYFFVCFALLPYLSPSLFCKRTWHPETQVRWLFWDICLPSSWSAGFLNKVISLASTAHSSDLLACHAASGASLDLVTKWSTILKYLPLTHVCLCSFVRRQMQSTHMFSYTWKWDSFLNVGHWPEFLSYKGRSRDFFFIFLFLNFT